MKQITIKDRINELKSHKVDEMTKAERFELSILMRIYDTLDEVVDVDDYCVMIDAVAHAQSVIQSNLIYNLISTKKCDEIGAKVVKVFTHDFSLKSEGFNYLFKFDSGEEYKLPIGFSVYHNAVCVITQCIFVDDAEYYDIKFSDGMIMRSLCKNHLVLINDL